MIIKNYLIESEPEIQSYIGITNTENINRLQLPSLDAEINEIVDVINDRNSSEINVPTDLAVKNYVTLSVSNLSGPSNLGFKTDWLGISDGLSLNNDGNGFNNGLYYLYLSKNSNNTVNIQANGVNIFKYVTFDGKENMITTRPNCSVLLAPAGAYITTDNTSWFTSDGDNINPSSCVDHFYYSDIDTKSMASFAVKIGNEISPIFINKIEQNRADFVDPISYMVARGGWINCENNLIPDNNPIEPNMQYELLRINSIFIDTDDTTSEWVLESVDGLPNWNIDDPYKKYSYHNDGYWYRYNGTTWVKRPKAWLVGAVACDSNKVVAIKCIPPKQILNNINNIKLEKISNTLIRTKNITSYVSVFGDIFESKNQYLEWDISEVLSYPQIFLYIDRTGRTIASGRVPFKSNNGDYVDQHNYWRCIGWCTKSEGQFINVYDFNGTEPYTNEVFDSTVLNSSTPNISRVWVKPMLPNKNIRIRVTCSGYAKVGFNYHQDSDRKNSLISGIQDFWNYNIYNEDGGLYTAVKEFNLNSLPPIVPIYFENPSNIYDFIKIEYIRG